TPDSQPIFSSLSSPGDFLQHTSQSNSPETSSDALFMAKETPGDAWNLDLTAPDAIVIPQSNEPPVQVYLKGDKSKTRAETQIKMELLLTPTNYEHIRFPPQTLAKPKQHATAQDREDAEAKGRIVEMQVNLVCATAVEEPEDRARALRRAAGKEHMPRRPPHVQLAELDKDDERHPQNGGEVVICEGCKERERKRYDRKKKKTTDEDGFLKYENDRVIMINEKEYKRFKEPTDPKCSSPDAKQVDFAMRIACYCRHQEDKSPQGYRVIFTLRDGNSGNIVAQQLSDIFHITDDHKNKEPEMQPRAINIPTQQYVAQPQQYPQHQQHPQNICIPYAPSLGHYSQPTTPIVPQFANPLSPLEAAYQQPPPQMSVGIPQSHRQVAPQFSSPPPSASAATFARHQRGPSSFDTPMISPTNPRMNMETQIPRPQSIDSFQFSFSSDAAQFPQHNNYYASAPQSTVTTPLNLSRPASPTWEQGPTKKGKQLRCVYFYVEDPE
ncbi:hypothetical protein DM02DRAFT_491839, partial [Periconia macrospinosa]